MSSQRKICQRCRCEVKIKKTLTYAMAMRFDISCSCVSTHGWSEKQALKEYAKKQKENP